jgi:mannose/cellobiose epimerase-like protein (N-acyl-D-glucosamine 2-epimerase family)/anti-anti-sigma regulatory factor
MNPIQFTFSDLIAGYVTSFDAGKREFGLKTPDDREFRVKIAGAGYGEILRNLGEPFQSLDGPLDDHLVAGQFLFAYGTFYPKDGMAFEAQRIVFCGRFPGEFRFEAQDWWINQIRQLAEFYRQAQFPDGEIDFRKYRTHLTLEGQKIESTRQETDTISRMIYGFASAYLLTGDDRYLEIAERGTEYLRDHLRAEEEGADVVYWYHAVDVQGQHERKILASQFGDDYDAIPAYEQIYALAGPVQTYRVTGDPRILSDARRTINLFNKHFLDREKDGYFSHIDPVNFDPRDESLGQDRARKNWNSVGDHAPAYLINLWLATGDEADAEFLKYTADMIEAHFPDYEHSSFVQEKFHEDWSHDKKWGWQQNRGVVGHNLKIAWNLTRIHHLRPNDKYVAFAKKVAELMPGVGMDPQRGGWYDVMERERSASEQTNRFVWHDRKAWWQQEQGILAYLIMAGSFGDPAYMKLARESSAFYNAWFPDHDNGGVYFNVLANGIPYLLGTERLKGSHSMSGYHSFELCYLAATYTNLLLTKQPMDLYFKPMPGAWKDDILRVAPDILPKGSIRIEEVWINGERHTDFDAENLTVKLPSDRSDVSTPAHLAQRPAWAGNPKMAPPATETELRVRVRIAPSGTTFDSVLDVQNDVATLTVAGVLDHTAAAGFRKRLDQVVAARPARFVLRLNDLKGISVDAARALAFIREKLPLTTDVVIVGANKAVIDALRSTNILESVELKEK